jgi:CarD family transcriptional regulator
VDNEALTSKMRPVLTREEVDALINEMPSVETAWQEDSQLRKESFDALLRSNQCRDLVVLIKTLQEHKIRRQKIGKALHVTDETYLREAQRLLFDELAGPLGLMPAQVHDYLTEKFAGIS